jgi:hypothetical protein
MRRSVPRLRTGSLKSAALVAVLSFLFAADAGAQDFRAKLTVTVTDPSGMAVPAPSGDHASTAEAVPRRDTGVYSFLFLQPRTYNLKVRLPVSSQPSGKTSPQSYQARAST